MNNSALITRYLERIRRAVDAGDRLRSPGGDTVSRVLDRMDMGDMKAASQDVTLLLDGSPLSDLAHFLTALIHEADGDRTAALATLNQIVGAEEPGYDVLCLTGDLFADCNKPEVGRRAYDRAIELAPHASHAFLRRGQLYSAAGDVTAAIADLQRAALLQPSLTEAHLALGNEYRDASMADAAIAAFRKALVLAPGNMDAAIGLETAIASVIPPWHAAMINDTGRNDAFDKAIRRAVTPGSQVLDIGTGTGLLAMMAARAGAEHVTACDSVGALADIARDIVALNGFSDRIAIVHKHSKDMELGTDVPGPVDVLITETVDAGLLGEHILETIADARTRLLSPDARIVPAAATVFAVPVECPALATERTVSNASGFDVTPFNSLMPHHYLQTDLSRLDWRPLTAPVELYRFDFSRDDADGAETTRRLTPLADGTAHAVALWFRLELDSETSITTGPLDPPTHWHQAVYAVTPPLDINQNEPVKLTARHNGRKILVALSG